MTPAQLAPFIVVLIVVVFAATYFAYFRKRGKLAAAGGAHAYYRQLADRRLGLAGTGERVTAAWTAGTIPEKSAANTAIGVAGVVSAAAVGVGIRVTGRPLVIACTSADRLIYRDQNSGQQTVLTRNAVRITDTGRQGGKRTDQNTFGFVRGQIVRFDFADGQGVGVDISNTAVPTLIAWCHGASVAGLNGPFPAEATYS